MAEMNMEVNAHLAAKVVELEVEVMLLRLEVRDLWDMKNGDPQARLDYLQWKSLSNDTRTRLLLAVRSC